MQPIIRPAQPSDAPEIARLATQLGYPASAEEMKNRLETLANMPTCTLVAEGSKGLLGWISIDRRVTLEVGLQYEIAGLVVDAETRRTGAGRALVDAAEKWAADQGAQCVQVRSNVLRQESHVFYQALGFSHVKTQHLYVRRITG